MSLLRKLPGTRSKPPQGIWCTQFLRRRLSLLRTCQHHTAFNRIQRCLLGPQGTCLPHTACTTPRRLPPPLSNTCQEHRPDNQTKRSPRLHLSTSVFARGAAGAGVVSLDGLELARATGRAASMVPSIRLDAEAQRAGGGGGGRRRGVVSARCALGSAFG